MLKCNPKIIIKKWSYVSPILDNIIPEFIKKYSIDNNLELVELNLLNETFGSKYWAICLKTNQLFAFNTNTIDEYNKILKELGYISFTFIELLFDNYHINVVKTFKILFNRKRKNSQDIQSIPKKNKEDNLLKVKEFLKDKPSNIRIQLIKLYEEEIKELKNTLDKHKELVREIKLKQILI